MPLFQILILLCLLSAVCTMGLVVGESIATKNPNTRFTKWWRRNVIGIMN
jgi:integral membrane sensor domain MASE1